MGLDNGWIVKAKTIQGKQFLQDYFDDLKYEYSKFGEYEFGYMRKNWGIRTDIIRNIYGGESNEGDYNFKLNQIEDFISLLCYYFDEKHWRDEADSIWDWQYGIKQIANIICNLRRLEEAAEAKGITDEDLEMYFYDSY